MYVEALKLFWLHACLHHELKSTKMAYFSVCFQTVSFFKDTPRAITIGVPAGMQ